MQKIKRPARMKPLSFVISVFNLCITLTLSVCIIIFLFYQILIVLRRESDFYTENLLETCNTGIESTIASASQASRFILNNVQIQEILTRAAQPDLDAQTYLQDEQDIFFLVDSFFLPSDARIACFYNAQGEPIFRNGSYVQTTDDYNLFSNEWIVTQKDSIDARSTAFVSAYNIDEVFYANFKPFAILQPLTNYTQTEIIAYVAVYTDSGELQDIFSEFFSEPLDDTSPLQAVHLVDADQYIIASTDLSALYTEIAQNEIDVALPCSDYGLTLVATYNPYYFVNTFLDFSAPIILVLIGINALFSIFLIRILHVKFAPLRTLTDTLIAVGQGNFKLQLPEETCQETDILELYRGFNAMAVQIDDLISNVYQQQILTQAAQLESLQYQINPHFLYNTLQTLEAIAEVHEEPEIQTISKSLADIFRYNLVGEALVPLEKELLHLQSYFEIEYIRFSQKVLFQIDIPEPLRAYKVPKFILQPLVENSLSHGFTVSHTTQNPCRILIVAQMLAQQNILKLQVIDNGIGIKAAPLEALRQKLASVDDTEEHTDSSSSIGLLNVHRRLHTRYGNQYGAFIRSTYGEGTTVSLHIPLFPSEETGL